MKNPMTKFFGISSSLLLLLAGTAAAKDERPDSRALQPEPSMIVLIPKQAKTAQVKTVMNFQIQHSDLDCMHQQPIQVGTTVELSEIGDFDMQMIEIELDTAGNEKNFNPVFSSL